MRLAGLSQRNRGKVGRRGVPAVNSQRKEIRLVKSLKTSVPFRWTGKRIEGVSFEMPSRGLIGKLFGNYW